MPTLQAIISVTLAGLALSSTLGPSMLYVLSRSIGQSRAAGLASALGLCLGGVLLAIATALGLATILATFDGLVTALKYIGSVYLIWLGLGMIRDARAASRTDLAATAVHHEPLSAIIRQGILVELLNPKTVLFFALFLPPFVASNAGHMGDMDVTLQLLVLGILVPLTAVPSDILVAVLGGSIAGALNRNRRARELMAWVGGLMLVVIAFGLHVDLV